MPLYEYECEKCGDLFEVIQRFADAPLEVHEKCGGPVHRLVSAPALQFKGSGWYITDYAKSGSSGENSSSTKKPEGASKTPSSGTSEGGSTSANTSSSSSNGSSSDKK
jgi:putative FmdB family regulatory protein